MFHGEMMLRLLLGTILLSSALAAPINAAPAPEATIPPRLGMPQLDMFQGANNPPNLAFQRFGIGWGRQDFAWGAIEPRKGEFVWAQYDRLVLDCHAAGCEILPMLGYSAGWANASHDGFAPPDNPADWTSFVEHTVARYSRPPFNLRYFQVWNEPTRKAGFWHGKSEEQWIDTIYIPAAKIIRKYGCAVVFGGWPCGEPERLDGMLAYHDAWRVTDIVDIHYCTLDWWQRIYDTWIATGRCRGIWQTEIGYLDFPNNYPNTYLRAMYWALKHDWSFAEKYKLFWFAFWGAGPDAPKCLTGPDGYISEHGKRAEVLQRLLGDGTLQAFDDYALDPPLPFALNEEAQAAMGFRCGERIVIGLCIAPATQGAHPTVRVTLKTPVQATAAKLVTATGETTDLKLIDGRIIEVPVAAVPSLTARNYGKDVRLAVCYVVVGQ
jgi:hypothetical protein